LGVAQCDLTVPDGFDRYSLSPPPGDAFLIDFE